MEAREANYVKTKGVAPQSHSLWSSVPYLFGGLAAIFGLMAYALLILACYHIKFSGYGNSRDRDMEAEEGGDNPMKKPPNVLEEKILVIMAGETKPTFIATPISNSIYKL